MTNIAEEMMGQAWPVPRPGDETADYGNAILSPTGSFEVRSFQTFTLTYTVGQYGLDDTGAIKIVHRWADDGGRIQYNDPEAINYGSATASNGVNLILHAESYPHQRPWYNGLRITVERGFMQAGDTITVVYGDRSAGSPGYRLQSFCESAYEFKVLVDPCATGCFFPIESPCIEIVAAKVDNWVVSAPSLRRPGEPFSLGVRAQDRWGNPACYRGVVNIQSCVPVSGLDHAYQFNDQASIKVDKLSIDEPQSLVFRLLDDQQNLLAQSNPLMIRQSGHSAYWGDLHGQSGETVGINPLREYLEFARDRAFLDVTSHQGNDFQITSAFWKHINELSAEFNLDHEFVVFPGYEWSGNTPVGGDHNVFFCRENRPIHRSSHALLCERSDIHTDAATLAVLFDRLEDEDCVIFAHVGGRPADIAYADNPGLRTAVEVHSDWGTFEWIMTDAFKLKYRVGLVCNSDGHKGAPGASHPGASEFGAYGGLTCFLAETLSREGIFECMRRRHHYGTTGCRMYMDVRAQAENGFRLYDRDPRFFEVSPKGVDQIMMGDIASTNDDLIELNIALAAHAPIERVDVLNGAEIIETLRGYHFSDLGKRIRIIWQGAEYRGRGRQTRWRGQIRVSGSNIMRMAKINAWNHERQFELNGNSVVFDAITTGNFGGCDLWLDGRDGRIEIETDLVSTGFELSNLGFEDQVIDAGGLERKLRIYRLPDALQTTHLEKSMPVRLNNQGDTPVWIKVTTEDGYNAWSSPMYLYRG